MARAPRLRRADVGAWLLTCNPRVWDIEDYLRAGKTSIGGWKVSTYRAEMMERGDLVFLWVTGSRHPRPTPGIRGVGRVTGYAAIRVVGPEDQTGTDQFWVDPGMAFRTRHEVPLDLPIWQEDRTIPRSLIAADPRLAKLEVIRTDASTANPSYTTPAETDALLELIGSTPDPLVGDADQVFTVGDHGAGFGEPLKNTAVELAAMHAVIDQIENDGWTCEDVSLKKLGWDITAKLQDQERHIEVKGVSGRMSSILLTRREYQTAQSDQSWELVVVTEALGRKPVVRWYGPEQTIEAADPYVFRVTFHDRQTPTTD